MNQVEKNTLGAGFCTFLYLVVHFIPDLGGADVMGSQWLYVSIVDFAILLYILLNQQQYKRQNNKTNFFNWPVQPMLIFIELKGNKHCFLKAIQEKS